MKPTTATETLDLAEHLHFDVEQYCLRSIELLAKVPPDDKNAVKFEFAGESFSWTTIQSFFYQKLLEAYRAASPEEKETLSLSYISYLKIKRPLPPNYGMLGSADD